MKLLVRNLARTTTEEELRTMFEAHGKVQSCTLVLDKDTGISKGFGFIEMPRPGDAKAAVKTLNGIDVAGNKIRVKKAEIKKAAPKEAKPDGAEPEETGPEKNEAEKNELPKDDVKNNTGINRNIWSK